jgi:HK97 family phage portal protein
MILELGKFKMQWGLSDSARMLRESSFSRFGSTLFAMNNEAFLNEGYVSNSDVFSVVQRIITVYTSLDWIVEEKTADGWVELTGTPVHELIEAPNKAKGYSMDDIEQMLLIYYLCTGNAYLYGERALGRIAEIDVLPAQYMEIKGSKNFFEPNLKYTFKNYGKNETIESENIAHFRFFNPLYCESFYGLSPLQAAARVVQTSNDKWIADSVLLQNKGMIGMVTDKSEIAMTKAEAEKIQASFNSEVGGASKFGQVKVSNKNLSYIPMSLSSSDLELIQKGYVTLRALCSVYGLDSSLFNDPENKTYNNRVEAEKAMYSNCIMPLDAKISAKLNQFIVQDLMKGRNVRMRKNFDNVECLQGNYKEQADALVSLSASGIITTEQAATELGYEFQQPQQQNEESNRI